MCNGGLYLGMYLEPINGLINMQVKIHTIMCLILSIKQGMKFTNCDYESCIRRYGTCEHLYKHQSKLLGKDLSKSMLVSRDGQY